MTKALTLLGIVVLTACSGFGAYAQEAPVQDITIEISTKFLTTYRDASWVPVDVLVRNTKKDVTGYLTLRLSSGGRDQAPVYRVPVDSPRGSTKRFRLYCFFDATDKISAMLYDGKRPAIAFPFTVQLPAPIMEEDFLHLVLDMNPDEGYAFLHRAVALQGEHVRAVRESLRPSELDALPDYPQCYEPYDAVMIGNLDPTRIAVPHRELLLRFVQRGGTLIVNTGANAPKLRGTWLEEASGAAFVTDITLKETELAAAAFGASAAQNAREGWECVFTKLQPQTPETQIFGIDQVLATRRPLGQGQIVALAIDVDSKSLQGCPEYIEFWSKLCRRKMVVAKPFFREAAWDFTQMIPSTAGIRVHPRSSVVLYLLVYFGVAIIANWVVWSYFKRREMAWVCLVFFSIGFTLYAMIVGTAGRAKANQMREVQVLQIRPEGGMSRLHSITAILTARTLAFAMDVQQENMLISDLGAMPAQYMRGPMQTGSSGRRPFVFTLGSPGRIDDFVVGASEVRSFEGEALVAIPGGFEGELLLDGKGLHGTLSNETGLTLENPCLLIDGALIPLNMDDSGALEVDIKHGKLQKKANYEEVVARLPGVFNDTEARDPYTGNRASFVAPLLTGYQAWQGPYAYGGPSSAAGANVSWLLGPCICGWVEGETVPCIESERPFQKQSADRFVMADVRVKRAETDAARSVQLNASMQYRQQVFTGPEYVSFSGPVPIQVFIPRSVPASAVRDVRVELYSQHVGGHTMCVLTPPNSSIKVKLESSEGVDFAGQRMYKNVYSIEGWEKEAIESAQRAAAAMYNPRSELAVDFHMKMAPRPAPENLTQQERQKWLIQV
ncbi:MAG: hypothetical protein U9Q79_04425, partial [Candidatus Hydrogenedentes bacterium]|nr:hypothetical protein [Candidatus Hydrogenedentota bacterium]